MGAGIGNGAKPRLDFTWDSEWGKTRAGFFPGIQNGRKLGLGFFLGYGMGGKKQTGFSWDTEWEKNQTGLSWDAEWGKPQTGF